MNKKIFEELDFTVRRADFEKAHRMIEDLKQQYSPDSEEYGELCYYELLVHYNATDIYEVKHHFIHNCKTVDSCEYCNTVMKYSNSDRKTKVLYIAIKVGKFHSTADYILSFKRSAEKHIKDKEYKSAIANFLVANEKKLAVDTALTASKAALKKNCFDEALEYLDYVLFDDECYEEYEKVKRYKKAFAKFQKEIGSPKDYALNALKEADNAKYLKYLSLSNRSGGYTDGVLHFISVLIALIVSVLMLFDPSLNIPALYVIWGICASIALHKKYLWDFGVFKSIGGTFLLCAAPALITAFADEILDANSLGAIITIVVTLIEFIPTLIRNIKYINNSKAGKKAVALRTQFVEPTINKARKQLIEKYSALTDRSTATAWANTIKL